MNRDQVIESILSAGTWEECQKAQDLLAQWMQAHPEDIGMLDAGETLMMTMDGLELRAEQEVQVVGAVRPE